MRKVKILVFGKDDLQGYINAIEKIGAQVVVGYPTVPEDSYDGLLLAGGADVHPKWYQEEINGSEGMDLDMDVAEFSVMDAFVKTGKPIMGICRGHQFINIYFGGSLYQNIPHADLHTGNKTHCIAAKPNSTLRGIYGDSFSVNSTHHQAVKKLGKGLRVTAVSSDNYVEAMEHVSLPIISVQWHPETLCFEDKTENAVDGKKILEYFLDMCKENRLQDK